MNRLELIGSTGQKKTGGLPIRLDDLKFVDDSVRDALRQLAMVFGEKVILWGLSFDSASGVDVWTQGAIFWNNEIYFIRAGSGAANDTLQVRIVEDFSYLPGGHVIMANGNETDLHQQREATLIRSNTEGEPMSGFTRASDAFSGVGVIPVGGIINYSGADQFDATGLGQPATPMAGWALCNGQNGTPNLVGRFIRAGVMSDIGVMGGQDNVQLFSSNIPQFNLGQYLYTAAGSSMNYAEGVSHTDYLVSGDSSSITFGQANPEPVPTLPAYYTLAYIMRIA